MIHQHKFWMVYLQGERSPVYKHTSFDTAHEEAQRLTTVHKKPSYILEAVSRVEEAPKTITTELTEDLPF